MIVAAIERLSGICEPENIWIVTNRTQKKAIGKLLLDFPIEQVLIEPEARNTAPCIAFAMATTRKYAACQRKECVCILRTRFLLRRTALITIAG